MEWLKKKCWRNGNIRFPENMYVYVNICLSSFKNDTQDYIYSYQQWDMLWIWIFFVLSDLTKFKFTENCLWSSLGLFEFVLIDSKITGMKESTTPWHRIV